MCHRGSTKYQLHRHQGWRTRLPAEFLAVFGERPNRHHTRRCRNASSSRGPVRRTSWLIVQRGRSQQGSMEGLQQERVARVGGLGAMLSSSPHITRQTRQLASKESGSWQIQKRLPRTKKSMYPPICAQTRTHVLLLWETGRWSLSKKGVIVGIERNFPMGYAQRTLVPLRLYPRPCAKRGSTQGVHRAPS